jgi:hypothetical protein
MLPSGLERSDRIIRRAARPVTAERPDVGQIDLSKDEELKAVWSEATG